MYIYIYRHIHIHIYMVYKYTPTYISLSLSFSLSLSLSLFVCTHRRRTHSLYPYFTPPSLPHIPSPLPPPPHTNAGEHATVNSDMEECQRFCVIYSEK